MKIVFPKKIDFSRIENRGLIESLEKLHKISAKLNSSLNLEKTLAFISKSLLEITQFDICNIYLLDKKDPDYVVCRFASDKKKFYGKKRVYLPESLQLEKVFEKKSPLYYWDLESRKDCNPKLLEFLKKNKICCSMFLPLIHVDVIGAVILDKMGDYDCPRELDKNILTLLNQAAVAIENAVMHESIKNQRDRWYAIFENSSDGIAVVDEEFKINKINASLSEMLELNPKYLIGKSIFEIFSEDEEKKKLEIELKRGFSGKEISQDKEEVFLKSKEDIIPAYKKTSFIKNTENYLRAILSFEDKTRAKELEQSKGDFISIVSHELRSPITVIRGFLSLLSKKEYGTVNEKQNHFLQKAIESTDRMSDLLEHILDVNRIAVGKVSLSFEPTNLLEVVELVKKDSSGKLKEKKLRVIIKKDVKMPLVLADKDRLYQIIYNLLENARKYSFPKSTIKITFEKFLSDIIFSISDAGVGISQNEQRKIFEKFSRISNSLSASAGGFGLGLYIVKNLVKAHGGRIWIESQKGKGATVNVSLKIAKQLQLLENIK